MKSMIASVLLAALVSAKPVDQHNLVRRSVYQRPSSYAAPAIPTKETEEILADSPAGQAADDEEPSDEEEYSSDEGSDEDQEESSTEEDGFETGKRTESPASPVVDEISAGEAYFPEEGSETEENQTEPSGHEDTGISGEETDHSEQMDDETRLSTAHEEDEIPGQPEEENRLSTAREEPASTAEEVIPEQLDDDESNAESSVGQEDMATSEDEDGRSAQEELVAC